MPEIDPAARTACLKRRLLFAAAQCYDPDRSAHQPGWIGPSGAPASPIAIARDYFGKDAPIARFGFDQKTDLALVGRIPEGVLVAFRGTPPPLEMVNGQPVPSSHGLAAILIDWLNDGDCVPYRGGHYPGQVHDGFARSVDRLWGAGAQDGLERHIGDLLADGGPRRLIFTGHSKGGPLANLAAFRARKQWPDVPVKVLTIAAARAGDAAFAAAYAASGIDCLRYEVDTDLVPFVPFGAAAPAWADAVLKAVGVPYDGAHDFGYMPVGTPLVSRQNLAERAADLWNRISGSFFWRKAATAFLPTIVDAHRVDDGSRYDQWVCETGCRHDWH